MEAAERDDLARRHVLTRARGELVGFGVDERERAFGPTAHASRHLHRLEPEPSSRAPRFALERTRLSRTFLLSDPFPNPRHRHPLRPVGNHDARSAPSI